MEITDIKKVYPEFKFFKDVYTSINKAPEILFHVKYGHASFELIDGEDSQYSILYGAFVNNDTEFLKWLTSSDCNVKISMDDINSIAKCLKKNAQKIIYDDNHFEYQLINKEGASVNIRCIKQPLQENIKISDINEKLYYGEDISAKYMDKDIFVVYLNNDKITDDENDEKLIEIPSKKILSSLKDGEYRIKYSDRLGILRYVLIGCTNNILCLNQVFATV